MNIKVLKNKFIQSLGILEQITKRGTNLSILQNVLIKAEKNFVKIFSTNLETSVVWNILGEVKKEGILCVPVSFLRSLVSYIKSDELTLTSSNKNAIIEGKNQKNQIQGVNPDDFPIIPQTEKINSVKINSKSLLKGISQIINIPKNSQVRPEISGIYFNFNKNELKIAGTDSFRLAEKKISLSVSVKKEFDFIVSQNSARDLYSILSVKENELIISADKNQISGEWKDENNGFTEVFFGSRILEGDYPNYENIIPKKFTAELRLKKDDFINEIKKAGLFSGSTAEIKFFIKKNKKEIKINAETADLGKSESNMEFKTEKQIKEDIDISFNYKFLLDGLLNIEGSEVEIKLGERDGPALLTSVGDKTYFYILMPIKNS